MKTQIKPEDISLTLKTLREVHSYLSAKKNGKLLRVDNYKLRDSILKTIENLFEVISDEDNA